MSNEFREYSQLFKMKSDFPNLKDFNQTGNNLDISSVWKGINKKIIISYLIYYIFKRNMFEFSLKIV